MSGASLDIIEVSAHAGDNMRPPDSVTVLITGAGGAVTPGLIRRLRAQYGFRIVAVDMDRYAVGLYWADKGYVVPPGNSPNFLPVMRNICMWEHVDVVIPLVDEELVSVLELESDGVKVLLPRQGFVVTCLDKFNLMRELHAHNIPSPDTYMAREWGSPLLFPTIVKPRVGRGSRGMGIVKSEAELFQFICDSNYTVDELITQPYIDGVEFTVSVVVWIDGEIQAVVPKEIVCKRGITKVATTRHNESIDALCRKIQKTFHADGPFNVQLRIDKNSGVPTVFEINPRFSTTTSLTTAAGVDEVGGLICQAINPAYPKLQNEWREGVTLIRRTMDDFVGEPCLDHSCITDVSGGIPLC